MLGYVGTGKFLSVVYTLLGKTTGLNVIDFGWGDFAMGKYLLVTIFLNSNQSYVIRRVLFCANFPIYV